MHAKPNLGRACSLSANEILVNEHGYTEAGKQRYTAERRGKSVARA